MYCEGSLLLLLQLLVDVGEGNVLSPFSCFVVNDALPVFMVRDV